MKFWTEQETQMFIELYPYTPTEELVKLFRRSKATLETKASKLNIKKIIINGKFMAISEEEKDKIIESSKEYSIAEICKKFNRSYLTIKNILLDNNCVILPNNRWWTAEEELFLKENYCSGDPIYISNILGRQWRAINTKALKMGLKRILKSGNPRKKSIPLSGEEKKFIIDNCEKIPSAIIAKELGRRAEVIINFCEKNKLRLLRSRKNPEDYTNEFLIEELKRLSVEYGRCPTSEEVQNNYNLPSIDIYYDRFGSFSNACELAGLNPNIGSYGTLCYSKNGDRCYSIQEQLVTNYFIDNNIEYIKEYKYADVIPNMECELLMDWYINNSIVVEYFGMINFKKYNRKTKLKQKLCKNNNIKLISIFPEDIKYLDKIFYEFINKSSLQTAGCDR